MSLFKLKKVRKLQKKTEYPKSPCGNTNQNKMAAEWKEELEKRQEARVLDKERKKQERAEQIRPEENPRLLFSRFGTEKAAIATMLCDLNSLERNALRERLDDATKKLQQLQKFLSDSFTFLTSYDVETMQGEINKLQLDLNDKRNSFMPKKKFAFSKKKQAKDNGKMDLQKEDGQDSTKNANVSDKEINVTIGQQITKHQNDLSQRDISFSNLQKCTLTLYGSPSALHLKKLESCQVFCGPVSGSVFINDCKDCVFVFPCQQLRVHNTVKSQFYLHVTSRAIIEDCHELGFAQFNWKYDDIDCHFEASRLDKMKNNWQLVDDFNWLKTEEQSPNWYIISEECTVISWGSKP